MVSRAERDWWRTAYHECGHAITRTHYQLPILAVTIGHNGGGLTETGNPSDLNEFDDNQITAETITSLAGPLAEAWYLHVTTGIPYKRAHRDAFGHSTGDLTNIDALMEHMGWGRREYRILEGEAITLVEAVWESIDAATDALLNGGGYLTGDQIYNIA